MLGDTKHDGDNAFSWCDPGHGRQEILRFSPLSKSQAYLCQNQQLPQNLIRENFSSLSHRTISPQHSLVFSSLSGLPEWTKVSNLLFTPVKTILVQWQMHRHKYIGEYQQMALELSRKHVREFRPL